MQRASGTAVLLELHSDFSVHVPYALCELDVGGTCQIYSISWGIFNMHVSALLFYSLFHRYYILFTILIYCFFVFVLLCELLKKCLPWTWQRSG